MASNGCGTRVSDEILAELFRLRDEKYKQFQGALIPNIDRDNVIGVRTPELKKLAKKLAAREDIDLFLEALPHKYFDENQLHAFIISEIKDFQACVRAVERFLPFVDNWATCDQLSPKVFGKHTGELIDHIKKWMDSGETYIVRFGIGMLMRWYLDEAFDPAYPRAVAAVRSEEYYVQMMAAWYFATALAKQYGAVIHFIEERVLDPRVHNKAIQKALESFRITAEQKAYLRTLKV